MAVFQRVARSSGAVLGWIVGSFVVYGAHLACGPTTGLARVVPSSPAGTVSSASTTGSANASSTGNPTSTATSPSSGVTPSTSGTCGCASAKSTASFAVAGDEKMVLDPVDSQVTFDVTHARGPLGKKQIVLSAVVRAYRTDVAAERPTTFGIRVHLPDGVANSTTPQSVSGAALEAYVTTWGAGSTVAPRAYASVTKSALTYTVTDSVVEIRGALTLKDTPTGRTITLDKLSLKKVGTSLLPEKTGAFRAP